MNGKLEWHSGIDYAPFAQKVDGDDIVSIADGIVRVAKTNQDGLGVYIVIEHDGYCSLYAHLSKVTCRVGSKVNRGEKVAEMGNSGHSTGTHLHFEIRPVSYNRFWEKQMLLGKSKPLHMIDPLEFIRKGAL